MNFGYRNTFQMIDKGVIELFGPSGFTFNVLESSKNTVRSQSGFVGNYALILTITTLLFLLFFTLFNSGIYTVL